MTLPHFVPEWLLLKYELFNLTTSKNNQQEYIYNISWAVWKIIWLYLESISQHCVQCVKKRFVRVITRSSYAHQM